MGTLDRLEKTENDFISGKVARLNKNHKRKAIFLDRDGVINKFVNDLHKTEDFELIEGVAEAVKLINKSEYLSVLVTNQPSIAKGYLTEQELQLMHKKMETLLGEKELILMKYIIALIIPKKVLMGK